MEPEIIKYDAAPEEGKNTRRRPETDLDCWEARTIPSLAHGSVTIATAVQDPDTVSLIVENAEIGHFTRADGEDNFGFCSRVRASVGLIDDVLTRVGKIAPE